MISLRLGPFCDMLIRVCPARNARAGRHADTWSFSAVLLFGGTLWPLREDFYS